jgi:hypothetical protein
VFGSSSAGGGITNTGTISGRHTGIAVVGIATFAGAIANISGGRIASKTQAGILVSRVAAFGGGGAGGIFNSGTISAKTGISIADSTITGAIFDFGGSILATSHGIVIGSGSEISAASLTTFTAIGVASAARFLGGIVNSGMLVGLSKGMAVVSISTFTGGIVNGGTITGAQSRACLSLPFRDSPAASSTAARFRVPAPEFSWRASRPSPAASAIPARSQVRSASTCSTCRG